MSTVSAIFDRFEGPANVGRAIGKPTEHATAMKRRGSIPVRYWPDLIRVAEHEGIEGVTYADLVTAHASAGPREANLPKVVSAHA